MYVDPKTMAKRISDNQRLTRALAQVRNPAPCIQHKWVWVVGRPTWNASMQVCTHCDTPKPAGAP